MTRSRIVQLFKKQQAMKAITNDREYQAITKRFEVGIGALIKGIFFEGIHIFGGKTLKKFANSIPVTLLFSQKKLLR
jgi:hypothetical protein